MQKRLKKGDRVKWDTARGRTTGTVQEVVTRQTRLRGTVIEASEEDPVYIVRCADTGSRDVALKHRP